MTLVPNDQTSTHNGLNKPRGLGFIRVAWFTVAMWLSAILCISVSVTRQVTVGTQASGVGDATAFSGLTLAAFVSLFCVPLAFFIRTQTYKKHWRGDRISLHGYTLGCLAVFVGVQPPALLALLAVFESHRPLPAMLPLIVAIIIHLANWPDGRPLLPAAPRLGQTNR